MNGLSVEILDALSFESHLGIPLKKNYPIETGKVMREKYESRFIRNEHEFKEVLNRVLSGSERS